MRHASTLAFAATADLRARCLRAEPVAPSRTFADVRFAKNGVARSSRADGANLSYPMLFRFRGRNVLATLLTSFACATPR
jgi:hypothetical protein